MNYWETSTCSILSWHLLLIISHFHAFFDPYPISNAIPLSNSEILNAFFCFLKQTTKLLLMMEARDHSFLDGVLKKDWISSLSDCLLMYILSFLNTKDAVRTGILSRRWRGLWSFTLDFHFDDRYFDDYKTFIRFVDRSLIRHVASKIKKFRLGFHYNEDVFTSSHRSRRYASHVDAWIHYAVTNGVEELILNNYEEPDDYYVLPSLLLKCETLISLKLRACYIELPRDFICFKSLRVLSLKRMEPLDYVIRGLLDGCPLLEDFKMRNCILDVGCLLHISSSTLDLQLKRLTIGDIDRVNVIEIQAPNLQILNLFGCEPDDREIFDPFKFQVPSLKILNVSLSLSNIDAQYSFKDMLMLKEAFLDLHFCIIEPEEYHSKFYPIVLSLLKDVCHAEVLKLSNHCVQLMSIPASNNLYDFIPKTKYLKLEVGLHKFDLPGIANLLRRSFDLETLVIKLGSTISLKFDQESLLKFNFDEREYWESSTFAFPCLEHRVKAIEISGFVGQCESGDGDMVSFVEKLDKQIHLLSFLLKNALVLEKMSISSSKPSPMREEEWLQLRYAATQKIKAIPRASSCAEVLLFDE